MLISKLVFLFGLAAHGLIPVSGILSGGPLGTQFLSNFPAFNQFNNNDNFVSEVPLIGRGGRGGPTLGRNEQVRRRNNVREFGCECTNFAWNNNGVIVGRCQSTDSDGLPICYLNQPNSCPDALDSRRFCQMQVSKIGCRQVTGPRFGNGGSRGGGGLSRQSNRQRQGQSYLPNANDLLDEEDADASSLLRNAGDGGDDGEVLDSVIDGEESDEDEDVMGSAGVTDEY